jgi:hypothetical protein
MTGHSDRGMILMERKMRRPALLSFIHRSISRSSRNDDDDEIFLLQSVVGQSHSTDH